MGVPRENEVRDRGRVGGAPEAWWVCPQRQNPSHVWTPQWAGAY